MQDAVGEGAVSIGSEAATAGGSEAYFLRDACSGAVGIYKKRESAHALMQKVNEPPKQPVAQAVMEALKVVLVAAKTAKSWVLLQAPTAALTSTSFGFCSLRERENLLAIGRASLKTVRERARSKARTQEVTDILS